MPAGSIPAPARSRRLFGFGRRRAADLSERIADDLAAGAAPYVERGRDLVDGLADGATPLVDRALGRRRARRRRLGGVLLVVTVIVATVAVVAWLMSRQPRDEEFARLRRDPDEPDTTPAGSDGPTADAPRVPEQPAAPEPVGTAPIAPEPVTAPSNVARGARSFRGPTIPQPLAAPAFEPLGASLPTPALSRSKLPF